MTELRLQKYLADSGLMSRRAAEKEILRGAVLVNGEVAEIGMKVCPEVDEIVYNGRAVKPGFKRYVYIMLNKPRGYVTTASDEKGRPTVVELCDGVGERIYPVGRLDMDSDGLLLLTNDGDLANQIMHPSCHVTKTYRVTVRPDITEDQILELTNGVEIDGRKTLPAIVTVLTKEEGRVVLQISIKEGRNRQIRKMCEGVGLEVARLKRTSIGPLKLGMLKPGEYRELTPAELTALRNSIAKGSGNVASNNKKKRR